MDAYYGVQTLRAIENFAGISGYTIGMFPNYVKALAMVKWAAAKANFESVSYTHLAVYKRQV